MSEVKSARELAHDFIEFNSYESIEYGYLILNTGAEEDLEITIKADRRAIIEKCKDRFREAYCRVYNINPISDYMIDARLQAIVYLLDSVLSEVEKDE